MFGRHNDLGLVGVVVVVAAHHRSRTRRVGSSSKGVGAKRDTSRRPDDRDSEVKVIADHDRDIGVVASVIVVEARTDHRQLKAEESNVQFALVCSCRNA